MRVSNALNDVAHNIWQAPPRRLTQRRVQCGAQRVGQHGPQHRHRARRVQSRLQQRAQARSAFQGRWITSEQRVSTKRMTSEYS
jgi:hypothetical protein